MSEVISLPAISECNFETNRRDQGHPAVGDDSVIEVTVLFQKCTPVPALEHFLVELQGDRLVSRQSDRMARGNIADQDNI